MATQRTIVIGSLVLLALLVAGGYIAYSDSVAHPGKNSMSLTGFSICLSNCAKESPYVTGSVVVKATTPLVTLRLVINGTNEFQSNSARYGVGNYTVPFFANAENQSLPIVAGAPYLITLDAIFQDNSTLSASTVVVAGNH